LGAVGSESSRRLVIVDLDLAVGRHVRGEQRVQAAPVLVGEPLRPGGFSEHVLDHQGVDVDEGGLEEMQGEDGKFLLVAAVAVLSPCSTDNTIFSFTSTGCFGGLATMDLLTIGWSGQDPRAGAHPAGCARPTGFASPSG